VTCVYLPQLAFTFAPEPDRQGDQLIAQENEMKTVRRILNMRSEGLSLHAIADTLNQSGAKTKLGGKWYAVTIQNVLKVHAKEAAA
jgi:Recombinase